MKRIMLLLSFLVCIVDLTHAETVKEINTALMRCTFKIEGPGSMGTCFLVGQPLTNNPTQLRFVLVTADHVLARMQGEQATVHLRKRTGDHYDKINYPLRIREGSKAALDKTPTSRCGRDVRESPAGS